MRSFSVTSCNKRMIVVRVFDNIQNVVAAGLITMVMNAVAVADSIRL